MTWKSWLFVAPFFILSSIAAFANGKYVPNQFDDCDPGVAVVQCKVDPCFTSVCPGYPEATCRSNLCGKCRAEFIQDKKVVDCSHSPEWFDDCPIDVPVVQCLKDPCIGKTCSKHPQAKCRTNLCGVCRAEFVLNDEVVTCGEAPPVNGCPAEKPLVACLRNPCEGLECAAYPSAVCKADYCGGCFANFYSDGKEVNCTKIATEAPPANRCPAEKPLVACLRNPCEGLECAAYPSAVCKADYCGGCFTNFFFGGKEVNCNDKTQGSGQVGGLKLPCDKTKFGCCEDGKTTAQDSNKGGCPGIFSKCGIERKRAIASDYKRKFLPTCNIDGTYTAIQCWEYTSVCWCVDFEGIEVDGTRATNRKPECSRQEVVLEGPTANDCHVSSFGCCSDGKTSATGPHKEGCTGEEAACWNSQYGCCQDGVTMATGPKFNGCSRQSSKCEQRRDEIIKMSGKPLAGAYIPQCTKDGEYDKTQCHGSTGYCWCVNKEGTMIKDTRRQGLPDCTVIVPKCVDLRKDCRSYLSYCTLFPKYMKKYCPKSCEYCKDDNVEIKTKRPSEPSTTTTRRQEQKMFTEMSPVTITTETKVQTAKKVTEELNGRTTPAERNGCGSIYGCCMDGIVPAVGPEYLGCPVYKSICTMPMASGGCRYAIKRYFYNSQQRRCEEFYYGGCGGNKNNFKTKAECLTACHKDKSPTGSEKEGATKAPKATAAKTTPVPTTQATSTAATQAASTRKPTKVTTTTFSSTTTTKATTTTKTTTTAKPTTTTGTSTTVQTTTTTVATTVPPLPECQVRHNIIIAASNRKLAPASSSADVYVPKCDEEGKFKMVQCLKSIDKCWCVDNDGNEIENTRTDSQNVNCPEPVVKCKNKRGDAMCNVFASYARYCQTYEDYMKLHCAKACNLCDYEPSKPGCSSEYGCCPDGITPAAGREFMGCPAYDSICEMQPVAGPCFGNFEKYFHNVTSGKCEKFIYGGCKGNQNNFNSERGCQIRCMKEHPQKSTTEAPVTPKPGTSGTLTTVRFTKLTTITEAPTSETATTEAATSEATTKEAVTTVAATSEATTKEAVTTVAATTEAATTLATTTEAATTEAATTVAVTTVAATTEAATTVATTTEAATTEAATTVAATTEAATTEIATTEAATTVAATTVATTTEAATTVAATTVAATTEADTTEIATTEAATTKVTSTQATSTEASTKETITTIGATAEAATTLSPATNSVPTSGTAKVRTTIATPVVLTESIERPTTSEAMTTVGPTTPPRKTVLPQLVTGTEAATTEASTTEAAATEAITTVAATTKVASTQATSTEASINETITTIGATAEVATTLSPTTNSVSTSGTAKGRTTIATPVVKTESIERPTVAPTTLPHKTVLPHLITEPFDRETFGKLDKTKTPTRQRTTTFPTMSTPPVTDFQDLTTVAMEYTLATTTITPPTTVEPKVPTTIEPEIPTTIEPKVPTTFEPKVPTTVEPKIPTTIEAEITTTIEPKVPTTVEPKIPTTIEAEITTTIEPKVPTTVEPKIPTTIEPKIPTTIEPEIPTTVQPKVPTTVEPKIPTTIEPKIPTTIEPEITTTIEPKIPTEIEPEIPTTVEPKVPTTVEPKIPTTIEPEIPTTIEPKVPTTVEPKIPTEIEPEITTTIEPKVPTTIEPEIPTTIEPRVPTTVEPKIPTTVDSQEETSFMPSTVSQIKVDVTPSTAVPVSEVVLTPTSAVVAITKCLQMRQKFLKAFSGAMTKGTLFIPECDKNGNFERIQCWEMIGLCWCVGHDGKELPGSRTNITLRGQLDCFKSQLTVCERERIEALKIVEKNRDSNELILGLYIPKCDSEGGFEEVQCSSTNNRCWCVDRKSGKQVDGTGIPGNPICIKKQESKCQRVKKLAEKLAKSEFGGKGIEAFVPSCEKDGSYSRTQCVTSTAYCWCVNENGEEIPGTRAKGTPNCDQEKKPLTRCQLKRKEALKDALVVDGKVIPPPGVHVPICERDGNFSHVQCHQSKGECWCVDSSGREVENTRTKDIKPPKCDVKLTECENQRKAVEAFRSVDGANATDAYTPQCLPNGSYVDIQCHASKGLCWCVDEQGKELLGSKYESEMPECKRLLANKLSKCEYKRRFLLMRQQGNRNFFVPQCHVNGSYSKQQCNNETDHCWCVNEEGTMTKWVEKGQTADVCLQESRTECEMARELVYNRAFMINREYPTLPRGAFLPSCDDDGYFKGMQCHEGYCWCVDSRGKEAVDTRKQFEKPECSRLLAGNLTNCEKERLERLQAVASSGSKNDHHLQQCTNGGRYMQMQCNKASERCWCVDENGRMTEWAKKNETGHPYCSNLHDKLTQCQVRQREVYKKSRVLNSQYPMLPRDIHLPECNDDGSFNIIQCKESFCWCVDQNGDAVTHSLSKQGRPDCTTLLMRNVSKCELLRDAVLTDHSSGLSSKVFVFKCDKNGDFVNMQCNTDIDTCWCVNGNGITIDGTITNLGKPNCTVERKLTTNCQRRRQYILDRSVIGSDGLTVPLPGDFMPRCNEDGSFQQIQCHESDGDCWCVDGDGVELINTRKKDANINCTQSLSTVCEKQRQKGYKRASVIDGRHSVATGAFIPQCNEKGEFEEVQCHGSTGYCWCVDTAGNQIPHTYRRYKKPECKRLVAGNLTKCELLHAAQFEEEKSSVSQGKFMFECDADGRFTPTQCDGFLNICWCVNEKGATIDGSEINDGQPDCSPRKNTVCQQKRQDVLDQASIIGGRSVVEQDTHMSICTKNGEFEVKQCHGSPAYCWCVDQQGKIVHKIAQGNEDIQCDEVLARNITQCEQYKEDTFGKGELPQDAFIPKCDENGAFNPVQCNGFINECWCVDAHGRYIEGTVSKEGEPQCPKKIFSKCQFERHQIINSFPIFNGKPDQAPPGSYLPECEEGGSYKETQCREAYCWCVDEEGNQVNGSAVYLKEPDCTKPKLTKCQRQLKEASLNGGDSAEEREFPPGIYSPNCKADGSYDAMQCQDADDSCFCVNKDGLEIPYTRIQSRHPECQRILAGNVTKCERERLNGYKGDFVSTCEVDGAYSEIQCDMSSDLCWCVDENGGMRADTETKGGEPVCPEAKPLTECQKRLRKAQQESTTETGGEAFPIGLFVPSCNDDGSFASLQCHGSTGYCFCYNDKGTEIPYTRVKSEKPECDRIKSGKLTKCELERLQSPVPGRFIPKCETNGSYKQVQCHGSTGSCWCVNGEGEKSVDTETKNGQPNCSKVTKCQLIVKETMALVIEINGTVLLPHGAFIPKCTDDGAFELVQCNPSTGFCWCVDEDGAEITHTKTKQGIPDCKRLISNNLTSCEKVRKEAMEIWEKIGFVYLVPQCDRDGAFSKLQCWNGKCWCVNEDGSTVRGTESNSRQNCLDVVMTTAVATDPSVVKTTMEMTSSAPTQQPPTEKLVVSEGKSFPVTTYPLPFDTTELPPTAQATTIEFATTTSADTILDKTLPPTKEAYTVPPASFEPQPVTSDVVTDAVTTEEPTSVELTATEKETLPPTKEAYTVPPASFEPQPVTSDVVTDAVTTEEPTSVELTATEKETLPPTKEAYTVPPASFEPQPVTSDVVTDAVTTEEPTSVELTATEKETLPPTKEAYTVPPASFEPQPVTSDVVTDAVTTEEPTSVELTATEKETLPPTKEAYTVPPASFEPQPVTSDVVTDAVTTEEPTSVELTATEKETLPPTKEAYTVPPASFEPQPVTSDVVTDAVTTEEPTSVELTATEKETLPPTKEAYTVPPASFEPQPVTSDVVTDAVTTEEPTSVELTATEKETLPPTKEAYTVPPASFEPQPVTSDVVTDAVTTEEPTSVELTATEKETLPPTKEAYTVPPASFEPQPVTSDVVTDAVTTEEPTSVELTATEKETLPPTKEAYTVPPASFEPQPVTPDVVPDAVTTKTPATVEVTTLEQKASPTEVKTVATDPSTTRKTTTEPRTTTEAVTTTAETTQSPTTVEVTTVEQKAPPTEVKTVVTDPSTTRKTTTEPRTTTEAVTTTAETTQSPTTVEVTTVEQKAPPTEVKTVVTDPSTTRKTTTEPRTTTEAVTTTAETTQSPTTVKVTTVEQKAPPTEVKTVATDPSTTRKTTTEPRTTTEAVTTTAETTQSPTTVEVTTVEQKAPPTEVKTVATDPSTTRKTATEPRTTTEAVTIKAKTTNVASTEVTTSKGSVEATTDRPFVVTTSRIATEKPTKQEITTAVLTNGAKISTPFHISACFLPRDPGPCKGQMVRYHYNNDPNVKDCVAFVYGGCRGNGNNFETAEECVSQCRDKVDLKTVPTVAEKKENKKVKRIPGCSNEFGCCDDYVTPAKGPNQAGCPEYQSLCEYPPATGHCRAKITRFYYNARLKVCNSFVWGGCFANRNNFASYESCMKRCEGHVPANVKVDRVDEVLQVKFIPGCVGEYGCCEDGVSPAKAPNQEGCPVYESICNMPAVRGYCQGSNIIRWHYNTVSGRCDTFRYSGCGGNENNFDTPNQCAAKCEIGGPRCQDKIPQLCGDWKKKGFCISRWKDLLKYCQLTCGFCNRKR